MSHNPYLAALKLVQTNHGTSGQAALAKAILSLYNSRNAWAMSDILSSLDDRYTKVVMDMMHFYAVHGATDELHSAGRWCAEEFPGLIELATAMAEARAAVHSRWNREREERARKEQAEEDRRLAERERSALTLHCQHCKGETKHYPIVATGEFECRECYERQTV